MISRIAKKCFHSQIPSQEFIQNIHKAVGVPVHGNKIHRFHTDRKVVITGWNASISDINFVISCILLHFMSLTPIQISKVSKDS
jgi:hypothetical protein